MKKFLFSIALLCILLITTQALALNMEGVLNSAFDYTNSRLRLKIEAYDSTANTTHLSKDAIFESILDSSTNALAVSLTGTLSFEGTIDIGTSGSHYTATAGDNIFQIYADIATTGSSAYTDGLNVYLYATGGDESDGIRGAQIVSYAQSTADIGELYGASIYAIQQDGSDIASNVYNIFYVEIEETDLADTPTGYIVGVAGIYDTNGVDPTNASVKAAVAGFLKDTANTNGDCIVAVLEGDTGSAGGTNTAFKALNLRSTAGDAFQYGLDLGASSYDAINSGGADIRLHNDETIDNQTDGQIQMTGDVYVNGGLKKAQCTMAADDVTPSASGCYWMTSQANTGATAITDIDDPVVGSTICLVVGDASNPPSVADSGNFNLSAAWSPGLDDVLCLYVQADNDYIEVSRSDN